MRIMSHFCHGTPSVSRYKYTLFCQQTAVYVLFLNIVVLNISATKLDWFRSKDHKANNYIFIYIYIYNIHIFIYMCIYLYIVVFGMKINSGFLIPRKTLPEIRRIEGCTSGPWVLNLYFPAPSWGLTM